jgi:hypothetical protein
MASTLETCANTAARPASPAAGDTLYQIDTKQVITYDGATWRLYDSAGSAVNDSDITGLSPHLWLDPTYSSAFFTDSGKGTGVTADGARVGCFADRSGNNFDFTEGTELDKPTLCKNAGIGNVSALIYGSTDELALLGDSSSEISAANCTIFFTWRLSTDNYNFIVNASGVRTNDPRFRLNYIGLKHKYNWMPFGNGPSGGGITFTSDELNADATQAPHIYCLRTSSSANRAYSYQNGGGDLTSTQTAPTGVFLEDGATLDLFNGAYTSGGAPLWLFEFMVFNASLSDANVNKVNTYLGNKHGITVTDVS